MLIAIHAPSGRATLTVSGASLGAARVSTGSMPAMTVVAWNATQISIENSRDDGDSPGGHVAIDIELLTEPLSSFNVNLRCTSGASMWFQLDGRQYDCSPNSERNYPFFGLTLGATTTDAGEFHKISQLANASAGK